MKTKGYLRKAENAIALNKQLKRFRRAGVPLSAVTIGGDITRVIDSLGCGDCLVVLSLTELSAQSARQKILQERIVEKGITLRPLDKVNAASQIESKNILDRLLHRLRLKHPLQEDKWAMPDSQQMSPEMQARVTLCMKPYYQLKKGVETICNNAGISPRTLYQFLQYHDLPNRRTVRAHPTINPLRKPGFPDNLQEVRPTAEKTE